MNVANEGAVAVYVMALSPLPPVRVLYTQAGVGKAGQFSHAFASGKTAVSPMLVISFFYHWLWPGDC
jgi:hypothetical protein